MSLDHAHLCKQICNLAHTCVMAEHPEREPCSRLNCHTYRGITNAMLVMAGAVAKGQDAFEKEVAVVPGAWTKELQVKAIQAMIPYLLEKAD